MVKWLRSLEERSARLSNWESWVRLLPEHVDFFFCHSNLNYEMRVSIACMDVKGCSKIFSSLLKALYTGTSFYAHV